MNPPFTLPIMENCYYRIEKALKDVNKGPLSFVLIIPTWKDDTAYKRIADSPFVKAIVNIPYDERSYCHGTQYRYQGLMISCI